MSIEANKPWVREAEKIGLPDSPTVRTQIQANLQTFEAGLGTRLARFDGMSPQNDEERERMEAEKAKEIKYIETARANFLHPLMDELGIPVQPESQPVEQEPALV